MIGPPPRVAAQLDSLPDGPGVYLWKDKGGAVVYVGKAKRLRQRVRSYFATDGIDSPKHRSLLREIADLDTIVVPSESQALLLENNLIKEYAPRFNIQLRDDKSYPSIVVTLGEPFPRVLVVRRQDIAGGRYFGPYTDVGTLRRALRLIRKIFTVRSCHYHLLDERPDRPCLDYHIQRCLAPCVGYQSRQAYRSMIEDVIAFLEGRTVEVRGRLRERMDAASAALDYERAAELRNAIQWLDQLEQPPAVEQVGGGNTDAIGYARDGDDAALAIVQVRGGKVVSRDQRFLHNLAEEPDGAVLGAFLVRSFLRRTGRARRVALPFPPTDFDAVVELSDGTAWLTPQRGAYRRLVDLADQNARHSLESFRIEALETDERVEDPVYALGRDLGLTVIPRRLVCVDISTSQGRDTVGSLVWFEGGRPKKSEYRKFRVKRAAAVEMGDVAGDVKPDDYAAIHEVVTRYVTRRRNEAKPVPDLMVIDGGKGQLGAARAALADLAEDGIQLASLAKREEEVFLPGVPRPIRLSRTAPSLRLLQRARDEAHRVAVEYNRQRRRARTVTSELMNIPGVGPARRRRLLERFGSLAGVRLASAAELATLPGISQRLAERILNHLRS
ncbi:MAG TPA: excinuclease ABC subunit UvrC [Gemmatimonadales bacterium]